MAALGAAILLIPPAVEPRTVHDEVDWDLLLFFAGLFIVGAREQRAGSRCVVRWAIQSGQQSAPHPGGAHAGAESTIPDTGLLRRSGRGST